MALASHLPLCLPSSPAQTPPPLGSSFPARRPSDRTLLSISVVAQVSVCLCNWLSPVSPCCHTCQSHLPSLPSRILSRQMQLFKPLRGWQEQVGLLSLTWLFLPMCPTSGLCAGQDHHPHPTGAPTWLCRLVTFEHLSGAKWDPYSTSGVLISCQLQPQSRAVTCHVLWHSQLAACSALAGAPQPPVDPASRGPLAGLWGCTALSTLPCLPRDPASREP